MFRPLLTIYLCFQVLATSAITTTWTNAAGDGLASNPTNWSRGIPSVGDDVLFSGSTSGDCRMDIALNVNSINLLSDYTGTVSVTVPAITVTGSIQISGGRLDLRNVDLTFSGSSVVLGTGADGITYGNWVIASGGSVSIALLQPLTITSLHLNLNDGSSVVLSDTIYVDNVQLEDGLLDGGVLYAQGFSHQSTFDGGRNGGTLHLGVGTSGSYQIADGRFPQLVMEGGTVESPVSPASVVIDGDLTISGGSFTDWSANLTLQNYTQTDGLFDHRFAGSPSKFVQGDFLLTGGFYFTNGDTTVISGDDVQIDVAFSSQFNNFRLNRDGDVRLEVNATDNIGSLEVALGDGYHLICDDTFSIQTLLLTDGLLDGGYYRANAGFEQEAIFDGGVNDATLHLEASSGGIYQMAGGRFPQLVMEGGSVQGPVSPEAVVIDGDLTMSGGSFTDWSGNLTLQNYTQTDGLFDHRFAGSPSKFVQGDFILTGGFYFTNGDTTVISGDDVQIDVAFSSQFNNFRLNRDGDVRLEVNATDNIGSLEVALGDGYHLICDDTFSIQTLLLTEGVLDGGYYRANAGFEHESTFDGGVNDATLHLEASSGGIYQMAGGRFPQLVMEGGSVQGPVSPEAVVIDGDLTISGGSFTDWSANMTLQNYTQTDGLFDHRFAGSPSKFVQGDFILTGGFYFTNGDTTVISGDDVQIDVAFSSQFNNFRFNRDGDVRLEVNATDNIGSLEVALGDGHHLICDDTFSIQTLLLTEGVLDGGYYRANAGFEHQSTFDGGVNDATLHLEASSGGIYQMAGGRFPQLVMEGGFVDGPAYPQAVVINGDMHIMSGTFQHQGGEITTQDFTQSGGAFFHTATSLGSFVVLGDFEYVAGLFSSNNAPIHFYGSAVRHLNNDTNFLSGAWEFRSDDLQTVNAIDAELVMDHVTLAGSGGVEANENLYIQGQLTFRPGSGGKLRLMDRTLTIDDGALIVGGSQSEYIITEGDAICLQQNLGLLGREEAVTFPVGGEDFYAPVTIQNLGGPDNFSVRVQPNVFDQGLIGAFIDENAIDMVWDINQEGSASSSVTLTVQWSAAQELTGFNRTNNAIYHYDGDWQMLGTEGAATGSGPYSQTVESVSDFSPFAVFSTGSGPLPIELLSFQGRWDQDHVRLDWETAWEFENLYFAVERSSDGIHFDSIGFRSGHLLSEEISEYFFVDAKPLNGAAHYRLRQVDMDGSMNYSQLVFVTASPVEQSLVVYPNPVDVNVKGFFASVPNDWQVLRIVNALGQEFWRRDRMEERSPAAQTIDLQLPVDLPAGVYFCEVLLLEGKRFSRRFVRL